MNKTLDIKILDAGKSASRNSSRFGKQDMTVYYSVNGKGKYVVAIPYEDYTPAVLHDTIAAEEQERQSIVGIEFSVAGD